MNMSVRAVKPRIVGDVPMDRNSPAPMVMPGTVFKA